MSSLIQRFEYDIFVSYRQKDNKGEHWVSEFVKALKTELDATFKENISIYFDENPHDGLLETHDVNKSLERKLKCLVFIPIISHTYCDPNSFAWTHEFIPFCKMARVDDFGIDVELANKNITSRILPIQIHDLDVADKKLFEKEAGGLLRAIDFIFKSPGVNRPLTPHDLRTDSLDKIFYRDQINKTANAIEGIIKSLIAADEKPFADNKVESVKVDRQKSPLNRTWRELFRRNIFRAALSYLVVALLLYQFMLFLTPILEIEEWVANLIMWVLIGGFPVAMLFAWFYEASPEGFIRTTSPKSIRNPYPAWRKKPLTDGFLITMLVIGLLTQYVYFNFIKLDTLMGAPIKTIAVLPFENRSGEEDDYIAAGITDDIINNLSIISQLKVTNRRTVQQYQGQILPYDRIAKELQVMALLIGSIQRSGNQIVIRAQMIDAADNSFIWGNTMHRTTDNIMALQSEIATVIADRLKIQLNDMEKTKLDRKPTENATAYDYYLRGRNFYYNYQPATNDSAIRQLKNAIVMDPEYALAWAGLGDAFAQKHGRFAQGYNWIDSSFVASARAIQLDSTLSDGYKSLAVAYSYKDDPDKALPLLLKAVELNPANYQAVGNLGTNYLLRGDLPTALQWQKKSAGMDPKNWIPYQLTGWTYRLLGDLDNAELWFLKSLELDPMQHDTYEHLGYTYVAQGRIKDALDLIPRIIKIDENDTRVLEAAGLIAHSAGDIRNAKQFFQLSIQKNSNYINDHYTYSPIGLGQILLEEGNKVEADVYLSHAMENNLMEINTGSKNSDTPFYVASIYAIKGNKKQSLIWLQKAIDANWTDIAKIKYGPYFAKFKTDPDFLNKMDLLNKKTEVMLKKAKAF